MYVYKNMHMCVYSLRKVAYLPTYLFIFVCVLFLINYVALFFLFAPACNAAELDAAN